mmetsp:Transcript_10318/g.13479  ORF Transcript_10318/g.13479 Transcript_10318/m.13479 type:complete len:504 (-) Transcript_10318:279-1790(-)
MLKMARLRNLFPSTSKRLKSTKFSLSTNANENGRIVAFGGLVKDVVCRPVQDGGALLMGSSMPGQVSHSYGGVARNIAETIGRLQVSSGHQNMLPKLAAVIGGDKTTKSGDWLSAIKHCNDVHIDSSLLLQLSDSSTSLPTPTYTAMLDEKGGLVAAIADFRSIDSFSFDRSLLRGGPNTKSITDDETNNGHQIRNALQNNSTMVFDANFSIETLSEIGEYLSASKSVGKRVVWWEPTSVAKCTRYLRSTLLEHVTHISPNLSELLAMAHTCSLKDEKDFTTEIGNETAASAMSTAMLPQLERSLEEALTKKDFRLVSELLKDPLSTVARSRGKGETSIVLTLGEHGVIVAQHAKTRNNNNNNCLDTKLIAHWIPSASLQIEASSVIGQRRCSADDGDVLRTNVTGAGDTLVGTALWWLSHQETKSNHNSNNNDKYQNDDDQDEEHMKLLQAVYGGTISAASAVLELDFAVPPRLSLPASSEYLKKRILHDDISHSSIQLHME